MGGVGEGQFGGTKKSIPWGKSKGESWVHRETGTKWR